MKKMLCRLFMRLRNDWQIYMLLIPAVTYFIIFCYIPMYGVQIAFRDYKFVQGIWGSAWVGLTHFKTFFSAYYLNRLFTNTFLLNIYGLIAGFPVPILIALMLHQLESKRFKSFTQTVIYVPHFISTVVLAGMLYIFLSPANGIVNQIIAALNGEPIYFMMEPGWFRTVFITSGVWQGAGWGSILYIATLTGIDPQLYEAATIDGANKLKKIFYIDMPSLIPVATMMLILNCGNLLSSNTTKTLLLQTAGNMQTSDIIGTYVYTVGLSGGQFSYTAAIGLLLNVINLVMLLTVNGISRKLGETSLF